MTDWQQDGPVPQPPPRGADLEASSAPGPTDQSPILQGSVDPEVTLRRIERLLEEIRGRLDAAVRAQRHREFSLARLLGALLQALVVGLVIAAVADWAYQAPWFDQLLKLLFAGVFQLAALTAFVLARNAT